MAAEILLQNEVEQEIAAHSPTEFSKDILVLDNVQNEGTPKEKPSKSGEHLVEN